MNYLIIRPQCHATKNQNGKADLDSGKEKVSSIGEGDVSPLLKYGKLEELKTITRTTTSRTPRKKILHSNIAAMTGQDFPYNGFRYSFFSFNLIGWSPVNDRMCSYTNFYAHAPLLRI